jgi:hypothetical protein
MDDAGRVSQQNLIQYLAPLGFHMCRHTPGLFRHSTRKKLFFITWVDDFLIKSDPSTDDLEYLRSALANKYPIKFQPTASSYISYRISLFRHPSDHSLDTLTIDMRGYVKAGLEALGFTPTSKPGSPIVYVPPTYGSSKIQVNPIDTSAPATPEQQSFLRSAVGIFRYYAQAIDTTLLHAISKIAMQQSNPTTDTMAQLDRFLNYVANNTDAFARAHGGVMLGLPNTDPFV